MIKNAMQLKAFVKNSAVQKGVAAQAIMQNYMLERLLERIAVSEYQGKFILKGGMLISALVGLDSRTTMDMDATLKGFLLNEDTIKEAFEKIIDVAIEDNITFEMKSIQPIREDDSYGGYRVSLDAIFETLKVPLKIDLTTGDKITPKEVKYRFSLMFENREIDILAYNLETVVAEKYETIIRRSVLNTRLRDFYDVYILMNFQSKNINRDTLSKAIKATAITRESEQFLADDKARLAVIANDETLQKQWSKYQKDFGYAKNIRWKEVISAIKTILPLAISAGYAFLTIRLDEQSILDFIIYATKYFITTPQYFEWRMK